MVKGKQLTPAQRARIVALRDNKWTIKDIALDIQCALSYVRYTLAKYKNAVEEGKSSTEAFKSRAGRGRKKVLTERDENYLKLMCVRDPKKSIGLLTEELNLSLRRPVSKSTVRNILSRKFHLNGRVAGRKPLLRKANIKKRLAFAKKHLSWTKKKWNEVLWTDESKFELFGNKRRVHVRRVPGTRYNGRHLVPTVKHGGGSIMVWGLYPLTARFH